MTDEQLQAAVVDELAWDPKVDSKNVAVEAKNGVITLRGTVGSLPEKYDAKRDAQRVQGVITVNDDLDVALLGNDPNIESDATLRGGVLQALSLDSRVPSTVDATVTNSWATLTGTVSWRYQRDEAEQVVARVRGVAGIHNNVQVAPDGPSSGDVAASIVAALQRNARIDPSAITVQCSSGTVLLGGTVGTWAEHDDAIIAAWHAPGVADVVDNLHVAP